MHQLRGLSGQESRQGSWSLLPPLCLLQPGLPISLRNSPLLLAVVGRLIWRQPGVEQIRRPQAQRPPPCVILSLQPPPPQQPQTFLLLFPASSRPSFVCSCLFSCLSPPVFSLPRALGWGVGLPRLSSLHPQHSSWSTSCPKLEPDPVPAARGPSSLGDSLRLRASCGGGGGIWARTRLSTSQSGRLQQLLFSEPQFPF